MMGIKLDMGSFVSEISDLKDDASKAVRSAAQAGSQVIYERAKAVAPASSKGHWFHGTSFKVNGQKYWFDAGTLRGSIYQAFSKDNSTENRATYHVSWNHTKCPYGFMVEFGTKNAPAHSFVRRAIAECTEKALDAMEKRFFEKVKF